MPRHITVRQADDEPLEAVIGAEGVSDLDDVDTVVIYLLEEGGSLVVTAGSASVSDSARRRVRFDPSGAHDDSGNALKNAGEFRAYWKLTWSDGDVTRHPADFDLTLTVKANEE